MDAGCIHMRIDMAAKWAPDSWTVAEARQLPDYPDAAALDAATDQLGSYPPLVFAGEARNLTADLARVAGGEAFLLQGRSAERRVGKAWGSPGSTRGAPEY